MTSEPTERPRRTPTGDEIPSLLKALEASGGNLAAFAREHGLAPWKLYDARRKAAGAGRRRLRRRQPETDHDFVRVQVVEDHPAASPPLELVFSAGHRLLIPSGFDEAELRRLMGVLTSC